MVLLRHIYKLRHWLDSSLPLDILLFFCSCILVFGHVVLMWLFYCVPWWFLTCCSCNCSWLQLYCGEHFVKLVASWEMFCYQLKECLWNVCWNGFAKGWVKPYYVSLSRFLFFWFVVGVFQINIITRLRIQLSKRIFIFNCRCIKNFLVRRIFRQSFRDGIW